MDVFLNIACVLAVTYVGWAAVLYVLQRRIVFARGGGIPDRGAAGVPEMSEVFVTAGDGQKLLAWFQSPRVGRDTVLYLHGNAGTIEGRGFKIRPFLDSGYGVLLLEYRGYGGNGGRPSERGLVSDGLEAMATLAEWGISADRVVLYGESLGTGVATAMATALNHEGKAAKAVILEAPFTSVADLASGRYPILPSRMLIKDPFDSLSRIAEIGAPLLILHGLGDHTVPYEHSERLYRRASEPKTLALLEGAGHTDVHDHGAMDEISRFLGGSGDISLDDRGAERVHLASPS